MAKFPALPLWTDALIGDTFHLTPAQFGAYLRLLIVEWRDPDCSIPNDDVFLGRSIGDPKNWHRLKPVILPYFTLGEDGRYRQKRLLDERDSCARYAARSTAGNEAKALKRKHRDAAKPVLNGSLEPPPYSSPKSKQEVSSKKEAAPPAQPIILPDWVPIESWEGFKEMRRNGRYPLKGRSETLALRELTKLRADGHDPAAVLDHSTMKGYRGLFPPPANGANGAARPRELRYPSDSPMIDTSKITMPERN